MPVPRATLRPRAAPWLPGTPQGEPRRLAWSTLSLPWGVPGHRASQEGRPAALAMGASRPWTRMGTRRACSHPQAHRWAWTPRLPTGPKAAAPAGGRSRKGGGRGPAARGAPPGKVSPPACPAPRRFPQGPSPAESGGMFGWAVSVAPERLSPWSTRWALGWGGRRGRSGSVVERTTAGVRSAPELVRGPRVGRTGEAEPWVLAGLLAGPRALRGSLGESSVCSRAGWVPHEQGHRDGCT